MDDPAWEIEGLRHAGLYRQMRTIGRTGEGRAVIDGREVLILCSNDYLGLAEHPAVREAATQAILHWGAGSGSSRLVAGNLELHAQLERELAEFKGTEAAVLFGSGYLANTGVIGVLAGPGDVILSDALNHASIIDGCRQSRAETIVYDHCDMDSLAQGLVRAGQRTKLVVTDAVFSMDGDCAPLREIAALAQRHRARVLVDEAHATGVVGPGGRGLTAELGLQDEVDVTIGTLSKALGSYGAFACCRSAMAELLVNQARTLIFSTALPPASVAAGLCALGLLRDQPSLVGRLHENTRLMRSELVARGVAGHVAPGDRRIPIVPLLVGDPVEAVRRSEAALRDGIYVQAIRPPTVPDGTSRLRLTVSAAHEPDDLRRAAEVLAAASKAAAEPGKT